jgi:hypothetical protein
MNKRVNNRVVMMERVQTFLADHPITPSIARVTELTALIDTAVTTLRSHDRDQDTGRSEAHAAIVALREKAKALRSSMRKVSGVAKGLSRELHPGLAAQFRMPANSYKALLTRANSFLEALAPVKAELTARGLPADFDEQLQTQADEFEALTQRRDSGLTEQVGGTAGLVALSKTGVAHVAELDSMLSARYADDPVLKAAWASAKRVRHSNGGSMAPSSGTPAPASVSAPAPAPVPAPAA